MNQDADLIKNRVKLINLESAEFYRHFLVCYKGRPVASGSVNITSAPIGIKKQNDDDSDMGVEEQQSLID